MPISVNDKPMTRDEDAMMAGEIECPDCRGTGEDVDVDIDDYGRQTAHRCKCSTCGGSGYIDSDRLCEGCGLIDDCTC